MFKDRSFTFREIFLAGFAIKPAYLPFLAARSVPSQISLPANTCFQIFLVLTAQRANIMHWLILVFRLSKISILHANSMLGQLKTPPKIGGNIRFDSKPFAAPLDKLLTIWQ